MKYFAKLFSLSLITFSASALADSTEPASAHQEPVRDGYNQETGAYQGDQMKRELEAAGAIMDMLNEKTEHDYVSGFKIQDLKCGPAACSFKDGKKTLTLTDKKQVAAIKSFLGDSTKAKTLTCDLTRDKSPICTAK